MTKKNFDSTTIAKRAAAEAAASLIQEGMHVGLGTGSTAAYFIAALGKRCQEGLRIQVFSSSEKSAQAAKSLGIPLLEECAVKMLDITVDGADEIDPAFNMIKGGGGALLREKLLAQASKEMVIIVDSEKQVEHLGKHVLPIEIVPYLYRTTIQRLHQMEYHGALRITEKDSPFLTDNHHYIYDIQNSSPILDPAQEHYRLKEIPGVVETGLFFHLAKRVIVGYEDGNVKILTR